MKHNLGHTLLYEFVVGWSDLGIITDAKQMLEQGEQVGLCWSVQNHVLHQLKALVHIVQLQTDVIEALSKLIKVLVPMVVEDLEL